ncbi:uroporphyrinogen-III synthase [Undibacterium arcticum]|uniref:Uroporphyrinogen-III synthase n=1 Tax=Undibacterium arcticum TaxID=1762892 RepID=A0ABV7F6U3_9BURK
MPRPVVITRPLAQAGAFARQVAALGREAIVFPLLEIHPLSDPAPLQAVLAALADQSHYALVAFVSPNAIDACFAHLPRWPDGVALAVVGEGSRLALAAHGVTDANATIYRPVDAARSDSESLLEVLDLDALRGREVLIIRGENGRELLGDALRAAGVRVTQVAGYRRTAPLLDAASQRQLRQLIDSDNDWIVTSSEALRILHQMTERYCGADSVAKLQQQQLIVPHARIAETAQQLGFQHITRSASGDESLLAALQSDT